MRSTGIIRRIDDLGRVLIPKEIRNTFGLRAGTPMEFYIKGNSIILTPYGEDFVDEINAMKERMKYTLEGGNSIVMNQIYNCLDEAIHLIRKEEMRG